MYHQYNILPHVLIFALVFTVISTGQSLLELYDLYENKNMNQLYKKTEEFYQKYPQNNEIKFFKALFMEDGDEALKVYLELFNNSQGRLKSLIAGKIAEFYYAKGFYVKASEYSKVAKNRPEYSQESKDSDSIDTNQSTQPVQSGLVIQVGAFKFKENAQYLQNVLKSHQILSRLVAREIGGKTLYCVWIDGKSNFEETRELAEYINQKFNLKYRIFKP